MATEPTREGVAATAPLAGFSYNVRSHEDADKCALVTLHCIGYPTEGIQPAEWNLVFRVPKADLDKWPLGKMVRLTVTA